nr:PREDICTED: cathepsin L 2-like [Bemisia tabaci]
MDLRTQFDQWKAKHNKQYASQAEDERRFKIYKENLKKIGGLNASPNTGTAVFGANVFADLTSEEYLRKIGASSRKRKYGGSGSSSRLQTRMLPGEGSMSRKFSFLKFRKRSHSAPPTLSRSGSIGSNPATPSGSRSGSFRQDPATPATSRTGSFGQDPAQAATSRTGSFAPQDATLRRSKSMWPNWAPPYPEPALFIGAEPQGPPIVDWRVPANIYPDTEPQVRTLIDCTPGNRGCEDGGIEEPLDYMRDTGVPLAAYYPYTARTEVCKRYIPPSLKITGRTLVPMEYLEWAVQTSPLPTTFNSPESLQFYISGVFDSLDCDNDPNRLNHAVTIVGHYRDAWIIRDSVIKEWGLEGHFLVKKGRCGVGIQTYKIDGLQVLPDPRKRTLSQMSSGAEAPSSSKRYPAN